MALDKKVKAVNGEAQRILYPIGPMRFIRRPCFVAMAFLGLCVALINLPLRRACRVRVRRPAAARGRRGARPHRSAAGTTGGDQDADPCAAPASEQPPKPAPNVELRAELAPGHEPGQRGHFLADIQGRPIQPQKELVWSGAGAEPKIHLKPGHYYIEATYGLAGNGETLDVRPEKEVSLRAQPECGNLACGCASPSPAARR